MTKYTKCEILGNQQYLQDKSKYDQYDIVYSAERNLGSCHNFTIYKAPKELSDKKLANVIDGFFFDVKRIGNILQCYFD